MIQTAAGLIPQFNYVFLNQLQVQDINIFNSVLSDTIPQDPSEIVSKSQNLLKNQNYQINSENVDNEIALVNQNYMIKTENVDQKSRFGFR